MSLNPFIRLAPITADTPIGDVKQRIISELTDYYQDALARTVLVEPEVCTTAELSIADRQLDYKGGVILGPNVPGQLLGVAFVAFMISLMITIDRHLPVPGILVFLAVFGICYLIYRQIKPLHRKIRFDHNGITIHDDRFEWADVIGTYMLLQGKNSDRQTRAWTLVIVNRQGDLYTHNINNTSVSREMFCTLVEYYRN